VRILVLYAHPCEDSFVSALHARVIATLRSAGHEVDDCDLYADGFDPVLSREERLGYYRIPQNRQPVAGYVERVQWAEALVLVFPVWNFGFPAILKGFFDRVFLPGVSFELVEGRARGRLTNVTKVAAVASYGASRLKALLVGDPPRRVIMRMLRSTVRPFARFRYLAHYDMNRSTASSRAAFLLKVETFMRAF
jgi:putative NADPH-quinone reductase